MKDAQSLAQELRRHDLLNDSAIPAVTFTGISNDSRQVKPGDLFICKGYGFKPEYLQMAAERGAVCYMAPQPIEGSALPCLTVTDVRRAQSLTAQWFYDHPSASLTLIGITGTKGKSTTTCMTHEVMNAVAGRRTGLLSGVEHYVGSDAELPHLTTPESLDFQRMLSLIRDNGLGIATTEISSQAYQVSRVYGEHFDFGVFLNIGPDHISEREHPTMEDYLACKIALLENSETAIICRDTAYFDTVYAAAKAKAKRVLLVGIEQDDCDYIAGDIKRRPTGGYTFTVTERDTGAAYPYSVAMDGLFNISNALVAIAIGRRMQGDPAVIARALSELKVAGRADVYEGGGITVLINYMHNGISCEATLKGIMHDYPGAYITVVQGIAGHRSPQRLQGIGEACGKYADRIFFTADDPGFEDPRDLGNRLAHAAADGKAEITVEPDRTIAVERAILEAPEGSVVVLGGKGPEDTQCVGNEYVYYESDPAITKRMLPVREKADRN
ncbi:MAG: UDP-N-acetylmuramyl-tripeptide synthetase [Oscillospiraceae bacterium]|nr:UDP-N-acetylmuramyl-tripeptide synthetase [Oscillospiraceae bacterium]